MHSRKYNHFKRSILLAGPGRGLFSNGSANYTLTLYPSDELFAVYSTMNPWVATIGAVCIIIFTSLLFFMYDFFVRRDFTAKYELLKAKRQFVRFVSHEVRTPLNSVVMGLTLLQSEIDVILGLNPTQTISEPNSVYDGANKVAEAQVGSQKEAIQGLHNVVEEIRTNAQSAVDVLTDLLNYDKVEMGTLTLELSIIPIWNLIEKTVAEFKIPATNKKIDLVIDFSRLTDGTLGQPITSETLPVEMKTRKVVGDISRICQVLRNLVSNALKFTSEDGTSPTICRRASCCIELTFSLSPLR